MAYKLWSAKQIGSTKGMGVCDSVLNIDLFMPGFIRVFGIRACALELMHLSLYLHCLQWLK